jgi:hypothetical protein
MSKTPVMIYPCNYTEAEGVPAGKQYRLLILSVKCAEEYMAYMKQKCGISFD